MTTPVLRQSSKRLLAQLIEEPDLDEQLAGLRGVEWKALVSAVGLEDSGELLALASTDQLLEVFDEELWLRDEESPGETIDAERFAAMLEVLQEAGRGQLAKKLKEFSEDFLRLALGSLVTVWPYALLAHYADDDDDGLIQKRLEGCGLEEFGDYLVVSSTGVGWDAIVELFAAWNESDPDFLDRLLSGLATASEALLQGTDDLFSVLDGMDQVREVAEAEREERRANSGYVSASDARAFLRLPPIKNPGEVDAITKAYFRRLKVTQPLDSAERGRPRSAYLSQLLKSQPSARSTLREPESLFKMAMRQLLQDHPEAHNRCVEELAFLVNVVLADARSHGAPGNPAEALRVVSKHIEDRGLSARSTDSPDLASQMADALIKWGPVGLFRRETG